MPSNYTREINCDFFRIRVGHEQEGDFLQTIGEFQARCHRPRDRNFEVEDGYVRLHDWRVEEGNASGAMLRLRTDGNARIGHIETDDLRDIELRSGEALVDYSCFRYFGEFKTLVLHRNRDAGNEMRLRHYLEKQCNVGPIDFQVLVSADALALFEQMQEITVAEVTIAIPTNLSAETGGRNVSVGDQIDLARRSGAATFTTRLSMDRTRRSLMPDVVRNWIKTYLRDDGETVRSAEVRGRINRGEDVRTIDLIHDRLRERVRLESLGQKPELPDFYAALDKAYRNRRDEISRMFLAESS